MTHLLDTDHLSFLQYPASPEHAAVLAHVQRHPPGDVVASVISFHEQVMGAHNKVNQARTPTELVRAYALLQQVLTDYTGITVLPFDDPAVAVFGQLRAHKIRISTMDLRIASIALSRRLVVVTRSARDFGQVPGLTTEDWTT